MRWLSDDVASGDVGCLVTWRLVTWHVQEEIPERIVSSQRLSQMRLAIKHQQAATDCLRFKQQARSKVGLLQELLGLWHDVIPPHVRKVLLPPLFPI